MPSNRRIAYWMSDKKSQKVNWDEFERVCAKYGYELFKVDLNNPLHNQEPFTVFLHKLTDIITSAICGDENSIMIISSIESYLSVKQDVIVVDPIDKLRQLLNRYDCYNMIKSTDLHRSGIFTPNFCQITSKSAKDIAIQLNEAQISYPFICKPILGHGSKSAHEMMLVFNADNLIDCPVPCVAQSFVNHDAILYKIFIIGAAHYYVQRPSLKNFYPSDCESIHFDSAHISKAGAKNVLNKLDPNEATARNDILPDTNVFQQIVTTIRDAFGMDLLGVDVVIENTTGQYAIIDVNAYPGYDGCPDFYEHLLKCIDAKVTSRTEQSNEKTEKTDKSCECTLHSDTITSERQFLTSATV